MLALFWISVLFIVYTLVGYVGCLWLLTRFDQKQVARASIEPSISILIVVRDGEKIIETKLRNCLDQDYPQEKMEVAVVCDGASPATEAIVESFSDRKVSLIRTGRCGKPYGLAMALRHTSGEIVVFTDAGVLMDTDALRSLVSNFADPRVGCVSSEDATIDNRDNAEPYYVDFDARMRRLECAFSTMIAASGSLFAARRAACQKWNDRMSSDFFVPLNSIMLGMDTVVDTRVKGYLGSVTAGDEFGRKVRTIVHGIHVLNEYNDLLNPFRYGVRAWELASHKLFRWLLPLAFAGVFVSSGLLARYSHLFGAVFLLQMLVYICGALAMEVSCLRRILVLRLAGFFVLNIVATVYAWVKCLQGEYYVLWEPSRR